MRRRRFLRSGLAASLVAVAGCSNSDSETSTGSPTATQTDTPSGTTRNTDTPTDGTPTEEDEPELADDEDNPDAPANYRWDLESGRNDNVRTELGQYVDDPGAVREDHPAFEFSTERETDDHTVDFEALRMIRDSNFDIFVNENPNSDAPLEDIVESFVDDSMYSETKNDIYRSDTDSPSTYTADEWLNADTVEESLDLGHNYLITLGDVEVISIKEMAVSIREAYQRHHDFDVLAWEVPMDDGSLSQGMMYSPDDDKIRSFATFGDWFGGGTAQFHVEIQDWDVIEDPNDTADADRHQHPIMFHTDEWDRQGVTFEAAKDSAVEMVFDIATDDYVQYENDAVGIINNLTMTTGATEQLTRTMLEYNDSSVDADFSDIRDLASFAVGKYIENPELNGVIDTVEPEDDEYDEYFGGGFAFYEVDNEEIVDTVRTDQSHDYDHFGDAYDELDTAA